MLKISIAVVGVLSMFGGGAIAQTADHGDAAHACQYAGAGFSLGSTVMIGRSLYQCDWSEPQALPKWSVATREETPPDASPGPVAGVTATANCLYENAFYGIGALIMVDSIPLTCHDGIWRPGGE